MYFQNKPTISKKNKMKKILIASVLLTALMSFKNASGQNTKPVTDYLKVAGPIVFDKQSFHLAWTSHPAENFYKQEYIPKNDVIARFKTMILIDLITGNQNIKDVVGAKIAELKKMQQRNPVIKYEVFENPKNGEYMLDFLLSQNSPDGKSMAIVERNVYRYKVHTDKAGKKGILLFGISTRSYGNDIDQFLVALKSNRNKLITSVSQFNIPEVSIN